MASKKLYIRVKRKHETLFLLCEPSQTISSIRTRVSAGRRTVVGAGPNPRAHPPSATQAAQILGVEAEEMGLLGTDKETQLPDSELVSDSGLADDDVLYAVRKVGSGFERVDIRDGPEEAEG